MKKIFFVAAFVAALVAATTVLPPSLVCQSSRGGKFLVLQEVGLCRLLEEFRQTGGDYPPLFLDCGNFSEWLTPLGEIVIKKGSVITVPSSWGSPRSWGSIRKEAILRPLD